jgi:hypothetical protein
VRKLREFYRLNKEMFDERGHFFLLIRAPVVEWGEFENRLKAVLRRILQESTLRKAADAVNQAGEDSSDTLASS